MPNIVPLFAIPLFIDELMVSQSDKEICKALSLRHDGPANMHITISPRILELPELNNLLTCAQRAIDVYTKDILHIAPRTGINMTTSWYIEITDQSNISHHYHSHSIFTGVIVLDASPNSKLTLHVEAPPIIPKIFELDYSEYNIFNSKSWFVNLEPNHIYIFPSTINHSAEVEQVGGHLKLVAFDTFISGSIGEELNHIQLRTV